MDIMDMVSANMGNWISIILFFAVFALIIGVAKAFLEPKKKGRRGRSNYRKPYLKDVADFRGKGSAADSTEQLRIVMEADFQSRSLLNRPEAKVFKTLDEAVKKEALRKAGIGYHGTYDAERTQGAGGEVGGGELGNRPRNSLNHKFLVADVSDTYARDEYSSAVRNHRLTTRVAV